MKPPLNYMMLNADTLATEFNNIIGYRTSHAGLVLSGMTVTSVVLAYVPIGETTDLEVYGTPFAAGCVTTFSGTGITVNLTTVNSSTWVTVNITVAATATQSARTITVTNTDGSAGSLASALTVTAANWLPYGSADASVIMSDPLTSDPTTRLSTNYGLTVTAFGLTSSDHNQPLHDATMGMKATDGSLDACYEVKGFVAGDLTTLDTSGQVTFQMKAADFCALQAAADGSLGTNQTQALSAVFSLLNKANSNNAQLLFRRNSSEGCDVFTDGAGPSTVSNGTSFRGWEPITTTGGTTYYYNTHGKNTYITINIGWWTDGGARRVIMAVDGQALATCIRADNLPTILLLGSLGNYFGSYISDSQNWNETYFRNFQLSTLAPNSGAKPTESALGKVAILSDSIIASKDWWLQSVRDIAIIARINRAIEMTGKRLSVIYRQNNGGHQLDDTGTNFSFENGSNSTADQAVDNTATAMLEPRVTLKATNPKTIVINGGSNDVADFGTITAASFRDAIRDQVCFFLGLDGAAWGIAGDYSLDPPGAPIAHIFFTNICDRGFNWNTAAAATGDIAGTVTLSNVSPTNAFVNGDEIGGYFSATQYIVAGTTVSSGGGTATITLSQAAVGTKVGMSLYKTSVADPSSTARDDAATLRAVFATAIADFATVYPSETCELHVIDTFNGMGGTDTYVGKITHDGVHPGYAGIYRLGQTIGAALAQYA